MQCRARGRQKNLNLKPQDPDIHWQVEIDHRLGAGPPGGKIMPMLGRWRGGGVLELLSRPLLNRIGHRCRF